MYILHLHTPGIVVLNDLNFWLRVTPPSQRMCRSVTIFQIRRQLVMYLLFSFFLSFSASATHMQPSFSYFSLIALYLCSLTRSLLACRLPLHCMWWFYSVSENMQMYTPAWWRKKIGKNMRNFDSKFSYYYCQIFEFSALARIKSKLLQFPC